MYWTTLLIRIKSKHEPGHGYLLFGQGHCRKIAEPGVGERAVFRSAAERMLGEGSHHPTSATSGASSAGHEAKPAPEIQYALIVP